MRKLFTFSCLFAILLGAFMACQKTNQAEPTQANGQAADGKQYRAVCIEKDQHDGHEYVLSKWMDTKEKANELGKYHGDFKYKGHRWRIDERDKPQTAHQ